MVLKRLNPPRIILLGYITIILIGGFLLSLPISTHEPQTFIDSIFTSTSGICVTGLTVKDTANDFTKFGKTVILILIQLGGLGYMTIASLLFIVFGKRLSIRQTTVAEESMAYPFGEIGRFMWQVVKLTLGFEVLGAIILTIRFINLGMCFSTALFKGIFHSISAFCNAGFTLFSMNLIPFVTDPWIVLTISGLIIVGGLGFIVLRELYERIQKEKTTLSLHTKLVLISTISLLAIGMVFILTAEWNNVLKDLPVGCKFLASFFQSVTPRTAGFNVVNVGDYKLGTMILTIVLMFIGASPAGTGGGIKTTTALLILMSIYSYLRGRMEINSLGRRIATPFIIRAFIVASVSCLIVILGVLGLSFSERGKGFIALLFEEISGFGTVGLSVGSKLNPACSLSYDFTNIGKIIIILTMLAGRVGSLTLGTAIIQTARPETFKLPKDIVLTG